MEKKCRIELLGGIRVVQADRVVVRFRTHKAANLLAYLALHMREAHAREHLVEILWSDMHPSEGRGNLSTALSHLRGVLEPERIGRGNVLLADHQTIQLNADAVSTDIAEFDELLQAALDADDPAERANYLQDADSLYEGMFLPGCFEEWAVEAQGVYRERYVTVLEQRALALEKLGDMEAALTTAQRAVRADAYLEELYRVQMRLYAAQDQVPAALKVYQSLVELLKEMKISPAASTKRLAQKIRGLSVETTKEKRDDWHDTVSSHQQPSHPVMTNPPLISPKPLLPPQLTCFIGRQREVEQLEQWFTSGKRLVTLTGYGGVGKTRLAIEAAWCVSDAFEGRVWFVSLSDISDPNLLPAEIARSLKLAVTTEADPLEVVVESLVQNPCLLVLDNMEHLLREPRSPSAVPTMDVSRAIVRFLLERTPSLTCLVTSRQPLHLEGEQEFPIPPLTVPQRTEKLVDLLECSSVALYVDRVQSVKPDFTLTHSNAEAIAGLCLKLEGIPLAIEMAAAWAKTLPPATMLERQGKQLDLLVSRRKDLPLRQRSLRATIAWSYELLTPEWQAFFARLSVFQNGWTLEAAESVLQESNALEYLAQLQDRSLIEVGEHGGEARYRFRESVREYAAEQFGYHELPPLRQRHAQYYLGLAQQATAHLQGAEQAIWLDRLETEHQNLRGALKWASEALQADIGLRLGSSLWRFWYIRGYDEEGYDWLSKMLTIPGGTPLSIRLIAMHAAGNLAFRKGNYLQAKSHFEAGLKIEREQGDRRRMARSLGSLANIACVEKDYLRARALLDESLAIFRELNDNGDISTKRDIATTLGNMAVLECRAGRLPEACACHSESIVLFREIRDWQHLAMALANLAGIRLSQCEYTLAWFLLQESLELSRVLSSKHTLAHCLYLCFCLAAEQGMWEIAALVQGVEEALRERICLPVSPEDQLAHRDTSQMVQEKLDPFVFQNLVERGRAMSPEEGIHFILEGFGGDTSGDTTALGK